MKGKRKSLKALILPLIAAMLIFIPVMAVPQATEAAVESVSTPMLQNSKTSQAFSYNYDEKDESDITITVNYNQEAAYKHFQKLNAYRATYAKNTNNKKDTFFKYAKSHVLIFDSKLEKFALERAAELCFLFEHSRPNKKLNPYGENISMTTNVSYKSTSDSIAECTLNQYINSNGHRQNMLSAYEGKDYKSVGIAVVHFGGYTYSVQVFSSAEGDGKRLATANNTVTVQYNPFKQYKDSKTGEIKTVKDHVEDTWSYQDTFANAAIRNEKNKTLKSEEPYTIDNVLNGTIKYGQNKNVKAKVKINSTNENVISVNGNILKANNSGTAKISFYADPIYGVKKTITFTVPTVPPASVTLNKSSLNLNVDKSEKLIATVNPSNATNKKVTWSSSNNSVATVASDGTVKAVKTGTATITCKTTDGGKTATCKVTVNAPPIVPTGVSLNKKASTLNIGGTEKLTTTITPSNPTNKNVTWTSSNTKVATVDKNGNVKAVAAGTATITSCKVNVDGWVNTNGKYSYIKDGKKVTGFYYFTSKEGEKTPHWSYFDKNGVLLTGWQWLGKGTNNPDGNNAKHMSYFGENGWLRTDWQQMGKGTSNSFGENTAKHWVYFGSNGWLRTGWVQLGKGTSEPDGNSAVHWSYFGENGWLRTGWQEMGNGTNNPDNNKAKHWSYFGDNGWLRTGKQTINKKTYTFNDVGWLTNPTKP